jgi:hypothetical protein
LQQFLFDCENVAMKTILLIATCALFNACNVNSPPAQPVGRYQLIAILHPDVHGPAVLEKIDTVTGRVWEWDKDKINGSSFDLACESSS